MCVQWYIRWPKLTAFPSTLDTQTRILMAHPLTLGTQTQIPTDYPPTTLGTQIRILAGYPATLSTQTRLLRPTCPPLEHKHDYLWHTHPPWAHKHEYLSCLVFDVTYCVCHEFNIKMLKHWHYIFFKQSDYHFLTIICYYHSVACYLYAKCI